MELNFLYEDYGLRLEKFARIDSKLAHYTRIDLCEKILLGESLWLKSASQMSDKYELNYGMSLVKTYTELRAEKIDLISAKTGLDFNALLTFSNFTYWQDVLHNTFLASFVEHAPCDDTDGRTDMWERYAGPEGVAFVLKPDFLEYDDTEDGLYPLPVRYFTQKELNEFFDRIVSKVAMIAGSGIVSQEQSEIAFQLMCLIASIKKPAYRAETEWRLIANLAIGGRGKHIKEAHNPRRIELNLSKNSGSKYSFANSLDRIIIGPGQNQKLHTLRIRNLLLDLKLDATPVITSSL